LPGLGSGVVTDDFIPHKDAIRGFVFDVATGKLNEVI
jgi:carbonic anhydrase